MNYEEALLMQAAKEEQERLTNQQAIILGSLLGGTSGAVGAKEINRIAKSVDTFKDTLAAKQGLSRTKMQNLGGNLNRVKRLAGTALIGGALGGSLGPVVRDGLIEESDAARLLAKIQAGTFTESDRPALERALAENYNQLTMA